MSFPAMPIGIFSN